MIILSPSILSADFANLAKEVKTVVDAGAKYVHIDVMDGHFVPNITIGPCVVESIRKYTDAVLDVHLMIENPDVYVESFLKAGSDIISIHDESIKLSSNNSKMFDDIYQLVKNYNKKLCVAVNPETDVKELDNYAEFVDMFLVMSVHPGFGGQSFIESSFDKIKYLREKYPNKDIEVDGGIKLSNVKEVVNVGANVIVAGSAVFSGNDTEANVKAFLEV